MRRQLLWELGTMRYSADELDLKFDDDGLAVRTADD